MRCAALAAAAVLVAGCAAGGGIAPAGVAPASASAEPLYLAMTDADVVMADRSVQHALETRLSGTTLRWRNPASGSAGSVTPMRTYRAAGGVYCRVYDETLAIGGRNERYRDTACRREDGFWQLVP